MRFSFSILKVKCHLNHLEAIVKFCCDLNEAHEDLASYLVGSYIGKMGKDATEKNIDYFIQFNDPTNYKKQMGSIIHAIFDYAI